MNKEVPSCYKEIKEIKMFLDAISDKNRLRIICFLKNKEKCVCEIYENLDLSQNLTSHHLKILEKSKILSYKKVGLKVFYKINKKELEKQNKLLNNFLKF